MEISKHILEIESVFVELFDSPGLQDGTDSDEDHVEKMFLQCNDVDKSVFPF